MVTAVRGFNPLVNRRFGKGKPSLVGKCFPANDRLLPRLLPPEPSSLSVCVEDETDAFDDMGGVREFGLLLVCAIEVAASRFDNEEMSCISGPSMLGEVGSEVGAVGIPVCGVVREEKCLVRKSPTGIFTAADSGKGKAGVAKAQKP